MATMIPDTGPVHNNSIRAEPDIYWRLKRELSDDFIVIHSISWISSVVGKLYNRHAPTGELDFLILHPIYGVLALEVKGGVVAYEDSVFILKNGTPINPLHQIRNSVHALSRWIGQTGHIYLKMGYGFIFPDSDFKDNLIPPGFIDRDTQVSQSLVLDKHALPSLGGHILQLMRYWKDTLNNTSPGNTTINAIKNLICPTVDYRPKWSTRIQETDNEWLVLTEQQQKFLYRLQERKRSVLTGQSGTGKTLLASTFSRELAKSGNVLFLVFNSALAKQLQEDLQDTSINVMTFHQLCMRAADVLQESRPYPVSSEWFRDRAPVLLRRAITEQYLTNKYTALIIDEAQVFHEMWLQYLIRWFPEHCILVCCDETQVFPYETLTNVSQILNILQIDEPFTLTINMRSPRSVFERVQEVFPSMYEQASRRLLEEDALEELAVFYPLSTLYETLRRLHNEGIDPKHITIVYIDSKPLFSSDFDTILEQKVTSEADSHYMMEEYNRYQWFHSQREIETLFNRVISIGKFRGLESPVIVVYATGKLDLASLACAYTRATTKCIVIYNIRSFCKERELNTLQHIVMRDVRAIQLDVEMRWPPEKVMPLTTVISNSTMIYWSNIWQGWVVFFGEQEMTDLVIVNLWILHLLRDSSHPLYIINIRTEPWRVVKVTNRVNSVSYQFDWCNQCNSWTRWMPEISPEQSCVDCMNMIAYRETKIIDKAPADDIALFQRQDWLLTAGSKEERKVLSSYLKAILYWNMLKDTDKEQLLPNLLDITYHNYHRYRYLFRLLTGVDILRTPFNHEIKSYDLKHQYQKWFPDIQLTDPEWRSEIGLGINSWILQKFIRKINKYKKGHYIRIKEDE